MLHFFSIAISTLCIFFTRTKRGKTQSAGTFS